MKNVILNLDDLVDHPSNSNVMPPDRYAKLRDQLASSKRYPPIVVRPIDQDGVVRHQILDGHHRVRALREIGCDSVACVAWSVDDDEALVLLATLNRLEGRDDPRKRALLLAELDQRFDREVLRSRLPEKREEFEALLALNERPPAPRGAVALDNMPMAVHFFLLPDDRRALESCLRVIGGAREEALMSLVHVDSL